MLGLALGGKTYKLKFGHHGGNHPVKDLDTGRIAITSQNHGFNVDMESLPGAGTRTTHVNLYDGTAEGLENRELRPLQRAVPPRGEPGPARVRVPVLPGSRAHGWTASAAAGRKAEPCRSELTSTPFSSSGPGPSSSARRASSTTPAPRPARPCGRRAFRVILVNSNPATIMTDPEMADATYIEPITVPMLEKIIEAERPDALLPTLGGQTGLNIAIQLAEKGILDRYGVRMIGADREAIRKAEDRKLFKEAMERIGIDLPRSGLAHSLAEARAGRRGDRLPSHHPALLHPRGHGRRGRALTRRGSRTWPARGLDASMISRDPDRGVDRRLEGIRAGGDAGPHGQRRHRLLHRELRPHGRAHGRLHHRGPRPDPDRQGIPAHARRGHRLHPRDRRGDRRVEHPVRRPPGQRAGWSSSR